MKNLIENILITKLTPSKNNYQNITCNKLCIHFQKFQKDAYHYKDYFHVPEKVAVEFARTLDADVGAYCRAYLFLRHYRSIENLQLIMLVDSPGSALTFYQNVVWRKTYGTFTQSPECRVPLYAQNNFVGRFLSWQIPQLLFLELPSTNKKRLKSPHRKTD